MSVCSICQGFILFSPKPS